MSEIMEQFYRKGKIEKAKDMAVKLAEMGISVEQIAKAAKCDIKTVESWLNEDEEDQIIADEAYQEYLDSDCKSIPMEDFWKELDSENVKKTY